MLPRNHVRTTWTGTTHPYRSRMARTSSSFATATGGLRLVLTLHLHLMLALNRPDSGRTSFVREWLEHRKIIADWLVAIGTILLAIIAVFAARIERWWHHPKLVITPQTRFVFDSDPERGIPRMPGPALGRE